MASSPPEGAPPDMAAAIAMLDRLLVQLEGQRAEALPVLQRAKGVDAESVFKAIKLLDDKIVEAREKRATLVRRMERARAMTKVASAVQALRAELEAGVTDPLRAEELRRRGEALRSEIAALRAEAEMDRQRGAK